MLILATSKIQSNYQTTIPKEIRKNYDIDNDTVVEWAINDNGNPEINFRKQEGCILFTSGIQNQKNQRKSMILDQKEDAAYAD